MLRQLLEIPFGGRALTGTIATPAAPVGLVVFVQRGGNPRNARVAMLLEGRGFATVLLDLLAMGEPYEELEPLVDRVILGVDHIRSTDLHLGLPIALFGGSLGGTAALIAASQRSDLVSAVVCRSAPPDLVGTRITAVRTPTLLIVGSQDTTTLRATRDAAQQRVAPYSVAVISGARERFDEPGALDEVAATAGTWLHGHLRRSHTSFASLALPR